MMAQKFTVKQQLTNDHTSVTNTISELDERIKFHDLALKQLKLEREVAKRKLERIEIKLSES